MKNGKICVNKEKSLVGLAFVKLKYFSNKMFFTGSNPKKLTKEKFCFKTGKCSKSVQIAVKRVGQTFFININKCSTVNHRTKARKKQFFFL